MVTSVQNSYFVVVAVKLQVAQNVRISLIKQGLHKVISYVILNNIKMY